MKIGIALSGGGARGIGHLGILQALLENDVQPTVFSGTSAGSLVGALYCSGYSPKEILNIIKQTKIYPTFRPSLSLKGLLKTNYLGDLLDKHLKVKHFEELEKPLYVVATDINKGKSVYFDKGELIMPIIASCCVPLFFEPVILEGRTLVDGGILDNLPSSILRNKCNFIIGCNSNSIDNNFNAKNLKNVVERSLLMAINGNVVKSEEICDYVITPPALGQFSGFDLGKAQEMFDQSYEYTLTIIEDLKSQISKRTVKMSEQL